MSERRMRPAFYDYPDGWPYQGQTGGPAQAAAIAADRAAALTKREASLRRMEASASPLLRDMAKALGGSSRGPVCEHGIDASAGCGRCMELDETKGAALAARFGG